MRFIDYIKNRLVPIVMCIGVILFITVVLYMFSVNTLLIVYIGVLILISYFIPLYYDYVKKKTFYNNLIKTLNNMDKKYLLTEMIKKPNFVEGDILCDILYDINKSMIEDVNKYKYSTEEFKEYLELWCHEIKTPIATSNLVIENNKNKTTLSIKEELDKIENYVEQMLFYARSENVNQDYIITKTIIKDVVSNVIKRNKKVLLEKNIHIDIDMQDESVSSDSKWLEFIINQIVSNSIKYTNKDKSYIKFNVVKNKNNTIITIEDNGIGINNDELDRVFQKGYTGTNGRLIHNSTGIGLYLCKKLCDKLGHSISITSKLDEYTKISILFPNSNMYEDIK